MVSPRRRQVIIGAIATAVAPSVFALLPEDRVEMVLSGRVVAENGSPMRGEKVCSGSAQAVTDADGRFVLRTASRHYRVADIEGYVANAHADIDGTWRATFSLTL
jgi:hypothetical protein